LKRNRHQPVTHRGLNFVSGFTVEPAFLASGQLGQADGPRVQAYIGDIAIATQSNSPMARRQPNDLIKALINFSRGRPLRRPVLKAKGMEQG
jgi:hypothetical protein